MTLTQTLRTQRHLAHLIQEQLAAQLHVSRQTISNWETGKTLPDIYNLIAVSDVFGVTLDEFIKGDPALQKHLDPKADNAAWFIAGTCFVSFMTVTISGPLAMDLLDIRLRVLLIIGQLLFSLFLLGHGRRYAHSFIDRDANGMPIFSDCFATWIMWYATAVSAILSVGAGIWELGI